MNSYNDTALILNFSLMVLFHTRIYVSWFLTVKKNLREERPLPSLSPNCTSYHIERHFHLYFSSPPLYSIYNLEGQCLVGNCWWWRENEVKARESTPWGLASLGHVSNRSSYICSVERKKRAELRAWGASVETGEEHDLIVAWPHPEWKRRYDWDSENLEFTQ